MILLIALLLIGGGAFLMSVGAHNPNISVISRKGLRSIATVLFILGVAMIIGMLVQAGILR